MTDTIRDDFEAKTRLGVAIRTFETFDRAHAWAKKNALVYPGLTVERVTIKRVEERSVVYRPRPRLVDLDVPAMPEERRA